MKKRIAIALLALSIAVPVFAQEATPEPVEPTAVETVAPEPTFVPTEVPAPAPVDTEAIPGWVGTMLIVLVLGIVSVSVVGIVQAAKGIPPWAQSILLAVADRGVAALEEYSETTPTPLDNTAVAELRKELERIKLQLAVVVAQNPVG